MAAYSPSLLAQGLPLAAATLLGITTVGFLRQKRDTLPKAVIVLASLWLGSQCVNGHEVTHQLIDALANKIKQIYDTIEPPLTRWITNHRKLSNVCAVVGGMSLCAAYQHITKTRTP